MGTYCSYHTMDKHHHTQWLCIVCSGHANSRHYCALWDMTRAFPRNLLLPSSGWKNQILCYPEEALIRSVWNIGTFLPDCTCFPWEPSHELRADVAPCIAKKTGVRVPICICAALNISIPVTRMRLPKEQTVQDTIYRAQDVSRLETMVDLLHQH
jgi:hypothetical protein